MIREGKLEKEIKKRKEISWILTWKTSGGMFWKQSKLYISCTSNTAFSHM